MSQAKHTPLPKLYRKGSQVWRSGGGMVADAANEATASNIVKCVNMHEELVAKINHLEGESQAWFVAATECLEALKVASKALNNGIAWPALQIVDAAIAKAEGRSE